MNSIKTLGRAMLASVALCSLAAVAAPDAARVEAKAKQRFAAADHNHDGRLTPDEARDGMPRVASNFNAIDRDGKGYVTLQDLGSYVADRRNSRSSAGPNASASAPN